MNLESSDTVSSQIHLLPEHLIDQIKAGEVIERPASLIKEIIENSIDAGSTQIDLHLVNCGIDLISIVDNGKGMSFNDLPFAFCRHATSKIERFEDLYRLSSFGFRGEALASICAIARVTCTSAPKSNPEHGGKIIIHGGETLAHAEQPANHAGTSLFIKDLFYNTPARLKFIKSQISEKNALKRIIQSFIISNPQVTFSIKWDDEDKEFYPATGDNFEKRISQVFNKSKNQHKLFSFKADYEDHTVIGFLSEASSRGNSNKKHFLFANHRLFTDKQIHQTIIRNSEGLYPQGEMGNYCIFIDVPPNLIDVNVHPNKTQIKFFKLPVITALISSELKKLKSEQNKNIPQTGFDFTSSPSTEKSFEQPLSHGNLNHFQQYSQSLADTGYRSPKMQESIQVHPPLVDYSLERSPLQLIEIENENYIIYKYELLQSFLETRARQDSDDLNDYIPLLISSPMAVSEQDNEEEKLNYLLKMGLQVERLDENALVLRSYHKSYLDFSIEPFVIQFLLNGGNFEFMKKGDFLFNKTWLKRNFTTLRGITKITPELLKNIFNE